MNPDKLDRYEAQKLRRLFGMNSAGEYISYIAPPDDCKDREFLHGMCMRHICEPWRGTNYFALTRRGAEQLTQTAGERV